MDFCQLLNKAQKNEKNSTNAPRYYSTKFEPPKKIKKETKELSENIKKFLAQKEADEKKKREEEQKKKEELLALRSQDRKATRRVNVMLKRTKSANKSVLEEAVDNTHTAVTRAGPEQPDEDDYGYVSQESSALYEKMMQKYSQMPEEPKFNMFKKKVSTNLSSTKDRVKAALEKEREEAMQPHRRKRKKKHDGEGGDDEDKDDVKEEKDDSPERKLNGTSSKDAVKVKPKPRPAAPPPMSFTELLKIAAQKQHEPVLIEEKPQQEEEKLYTKKQRREMEREREERERRERRLLEMEKHEKQKSVKVPKSLLEKQLTKPGNERDKVQLKTKSSEFMKKTFNDSKVLSKSGSTNSMTAKSEDKHRKIDKLSTSSNNKSQISNSKNNIPTKSEPKLPMKSVKVTNNVKPKELPPKDLHLKIKAQEFPSKNVKTKQFPPQNGQGIKRKSSAAVHKGRILDDSDEEYDSELDDFIDDGPEGGDNYSSYIKEIFGYDKSRYKDLDDDDANMETSFAQQMREEVISTKIGIMEDLEDIKKEEDEKRRKALMKKKMRR